MSSNPSLLHYKDVQDVFDRALLEANGVSLTFESFAEAVRWSQRAHQFRKLDRKRNAHIYPDPAHAMHGASVYDSLLVRRPKAEPMRVIVEKVSLGAVKMEAL